MKLALLLTLLISLGYLSVVGITFFTKKNVNTFETGIYKIIFFTAFLSIFVELSLYLLSGIYGVNHLYDLLYLLLCKLYVVVVFFWYYMMLNYTYSLRSKYDFSSSKGNKFKKYFLIISIFLILLAPIDFYMDSNNQGYATGAATKVAFLTILISCINMVYLLIKTRKHIKNREFIPVIILPFLLIGSTIIQATYPQILLFNQVMSFITFIMYHTIENPDMKMLVEYNKNKQLLEDNIEEKSNLLFKITQDVREPISEINNLSNDILKKKRLNDVYERANEVSDLSKNVINTINSVLDISQLDINNIKVFDNTYNVYNLFNQVVYLTKNNISNNTDFKYSISSVVPKSLFGDGLKVKQIICSVLNYSINNTKSGYVDLDISSFNKYDVCRLVVTIADTGRELSLLEINDILEKNDYVFERDLANIDDLFIDIKLVKVLVDMMGGNLLIKSEKDKGTTYTIVLNQKIEQDDSLKLQGSMEALSASLSNKKRILLVDDDYQELKMISKKLKSNRFDVITTMYGKDCIDRLKYDSSIDLVLIDDEMKPDNAVNLINDIDTKKVKVVIMLNKNKESIKEHYLEDYPLFDCFIKDNIDNEIKKLFNKLYNK